MTGATPLDRFKLIITLAGFHLDTIKFLQDISRLPMWASLLMTNEVFSFSAVRKKLLNMYDVPQCCTQRELSSAERRPK